MIQLIERFERMGRRGGVAAVAVAIALLAVAVAAVVASFGPDARWGPLLLRGVAGLAFALAMVFTAVGVRLLTAREYPSPEALFPSMDRDAFLRALEDRPICACVRCLVTVPARFSTGACPRCTSTVDYYEVGSEADAEMVRLALR